MKQNQPTHLPQKQLELVRVPQLTSVIILNQTYDNCLTDFESLAAGQGGRFTSQLGRCRLTARSHAGSTLITLWREHSRLGEARLCWSSKCRNELRVSVGLRGHLLSELNIPCLLVTLANKFETKATPKEINLVLHTLAASAFGILRHLARKPAHVVLDKPVLLPAADLVTELFGKKETGETEIFDLARHLLNLQPSNKSSAQY